MTDEMRERVQQALERFYDEGPHGPPLTDVIADLLRQEIAAERTSVRDRLIEARRQLIQGTLTAGMMSEIIDRAR